MLMYTLLCFGSFWITNREKIDKNDFLTQRQHLIEKDSGTTLHEKRSSLKYTTYATQQSCVFKRHFKNPFLPSGCGIFFNNIDTEKAEWPMLTTVNWKGPPHSPPGCQHAAILQITNICDFSKPVFRLSQLHLLAAGLYCSQTTVLTNMTLRSKFYRHHSFPPMGIFMSYGYIQMSYDQASALRWLLILAGVELNPGPATTRSSNSQAKSYADLSATNLNDSDVIDDEFIYILHIPRPPVLKCKFCRNSRNSNSAMIQHLKKECLGGMQVIVKFNCSRCNRQFVKEKEAERHYQKCNPIPICTVDIPSSKCNEGFCKATEAALISLKVNETDMDGIRGSQWLSGDIVEFSLLRLCQKAARQHPKGLVSFVPLSPHFTQLLEEFANGNLNSDQKLHYQGWTNVEIVFFPLHKGNHWTLLIINNRTRKFQHYDSLNAISHQTFAKTVCNQVAEFVSKKLGSDHYKSYAFESVAGGHQNDGYNCGVYVILTAQSVIEDGNTGQFDATSCNSWRKNFPAFYNEAFSSLSVDASAASSATAPSSASKVTAHAGQMPITASPAVGPPVHILAVASPAASPAAATSSASKAASPAGLMPNAASPAVVPTVPILAVAAPDVLSAAVPPSASKAAAGPTDLMPIATPPAMVPPAPILLVAASAASSSAGPSSASKATASAGLIPIAASPTVVPPVPILAVAALAAPSAATPSFALRAAALTGTSSTAKVSTASAARLPPISVPSASFSARQPKFKPPAVKKKHFGSPNSSTNALPTDESLFIHLGTKTMNWIPKAARFQAAILLGRLIDDVVFKNSWESWQRLMSFAPVCLCGSPKSDPQSSSLASKVKQRVSNFDNLWKKPDTGSNSKTKGTGKKRTEAELKKGLAKLVSKKICEGDVKGAVRVASSQDSLAPNNPETTKKLQALHPPLLTPLENMAPSKSDQACCLVVEERGVKRAIMSFRPGSSGGPSALRPQHLKNLISLQTGEAGERLLRSLTSLANLVLQGNVPAPVRPYFFGASLTALSKNNGGVRPIACGDTLRRLVAKTACHLVSAEQAADLRPIQMGVATKNGTEVVVHAVRRFLFASEGKVIFKVDFANAFNAISRHSILNQVREKVPCLYSFAFSSYSQSANLFYRDEVFNSQEGVQQGDPLGPLYFSRGIHPIISGCQSELNAWYLDDGTIGGLAPTVLADCMRVREESLKVGLQLNPQKCELTVLEHDTARRSQIISEFQAEFPGVKIVDPSDLDLLGAPLCHSNIPKVLQSKIEALHHLAESIKVLDAHDAIFLLRHCMSIPKLLYTLRCTPCFLDKISLARYDAEVRNILQTVLNVKLMDHSWEQAALPIKFGGIGVRKAIDIALPAYLASTSQCRDLSREVWSGVCTDIDRVGQIAREQWNIMGLDVPDDPNIQQHWDHTNCEKILETLRGRHANDPQQLARLLACTSEGSGDWLNAAPIPSLGLKLSPPQLRIAVSLRLGVDMCEPHYCICGKQVDKTGVHGLSCVKSKGRLPRHSMVNDLVKRGLNSAGVPATLEPAGLSLPDGKRPDGLTLIPWANGKCLTWDFTCSDTVAPSHLQVSSKRPREVANMAERVKESKYAALKDSYSVVPIAIETLGAYGDSAWDFFKALGRKIKKETGEPRSGAFLRQAVGMAIQRGNAISVIGTMPPSKPLDEVYYVA